MAVYIQSSKSEMADSYEVRIGNETIKHHFGRKVPIIQAVKMVREWLSAIDGEKTP